MLSVMQAAHTSNQLIDGKLQPPAVFIWIVKKGASLSWEAKALAMGLSFQEVFDFVHCGKVQILLTSYSVLKKNLQNSVLVGSLLLNGRCGPTKGAAGSLPNGRRTPTKRA